MKKILFIAVVVIFIILAVIGIGVGFAALRPEAHRVKIEQALEKYFNGDAKIAHLSLVWQNQYPGLEIQNIDLRPHGSASQETQPQANADSFTADSARLFMDFNALLKKELRVKSVLLDRPRLNLTRPADGHGQNGMRVQGGASGDPLGWGGMTWKVDEVVLQNGELHYLSGGPGHPHDWSLKNLNLKVRPKRPDQGIAFEGKAAILTDTTNTNFSGTLHREGGSGGWTLMFSKIRAGFADVSVRSLEEAIPILEAAGLRGRLAGALSASIERLSYEAGNWTDVAGSVQVEGAKFFIRVFKSPLTEFNLSTQFDRDTVVISSLDGEVAHGTFRGHGEIRNLNKPDPDASFEMNVDRINLSELFSRPANGRPQLAGRIAFDVNGLVQGRERRQWLATLQGQGRASLTDGVLTNLNIMRMIFDKLAVSLPGAREAFAQSMPPQISQLLSLPDTHLSPTDINFTFGNGGIAYANFRIAGDGFEIYGSGQQGFGGDIDFKTTIVLDAQISSYIVYCCPDASALADSSGRLVMPVRISGTIRNIRIEPDTNYLIRKVLGVKGPEYLMKALQQKV
jgi:hypothetical protein